MRKVVTTGLFSLCFVRGTELTSNSMVSNTQSVTENPSAEINRILKKINEQNSWIKPPMINIDPPSSADRIIDDMPQSIDISDGASAFIQRMINYNRHWDGHRFDSSSKRKVILLKSVFNGKIPMKERDIGILISRHMIEKGAECHLRSDVNGRKYVIIEYQLKSEKQRRSVMITPQTGFQLIRDVISSVKKYGILIQSSQKKNKDSECDSDDDSDDDNDDVNGLMSYYDIMLHLMGLGNIDNVLKQLDLMNEKDWDLKSIKEMAESIMFDEMVRFTTMLILRRSHGRPGVERDVFDVMMSRLKCGDDLSFRMHVYNAILNQSWMDEAMLSHWTCKDLNQWCLFYDSMIHYINDMNNNDNNNNDEIRVILALFGNPDFREHMRYLLHSITIIPNKQKSKPKNDDSSFWIDLKRLSKELKSKRKQLKIQGNGKQMRMDDIKEIVNKIKEPSQPDDSSSSLVSSPNIRYFDLGTIMEWIHLVIQNHPYYEINLSNPVRIDGLEATMIPQDMDEYYHILDQIDSTNTICEYDSNNNIYTRMHELFKQCRCHIEISDPLLSLNVFDEYLRNHQAFEATLLISQFQTILSVKNVPIQHPSWNMINRMSHRCSDSLIEEYMNLLHHLLECITPKHECMVYLHANVNEARRILGSDTSLFTDLRLLIRLAYRYWTASYEQWMMEEIHLIDQVTQTIIQIQQLDQNTKQMWNLFTKNQNDNPKGFDLAQRIQNKIMNDLQKKLNNALLQMDNADQALIKGDASMVEMECLKQAMDDLEKKTSLMNNDKNDNDDENDDDEQNGNDDENGTNMVMIHELIPKMNEKLKQLNDAIKISEYEEKKKRKQMKQRTKKNHGSSNNNSPKSSKRRT